VAIGAVKLQPVTFGRWTVTAEAAGSSPFVPAIFSMSYRRSVSLRLHIRCTPSALTLHKVVAKFLSNEIQRQ